jgi:hypothetical protein
MTVFAGYLAVVRPGQIINLFIAAFALYLVTTSCMTARRREPAAPRLSDKLALAVSATLCAPFALVMFQAVSGVRVFKTAFAIDGPILIALVSFASVIAIAAIGDARVVFGAPLMGAPRIARHLWRMCVGLTLATGSAFTNGFARLLPGPYHVPAIFFFPQFLPLLVLVFWMIRLFFTDWIKRATPAFST